MQDFHKMLEYSPLSVLRCHSRRNNPCDFQTQVWGCQFAPYQENEASEWKQHLFATCGGYSCCITDAETGDVIMKFEDDNKSEDFYTLAWSSFEQGDVLLAVAGAKGMIYILSLVSKSLYHSFSVNAEKRSPGVFTLLFDKEEPSLLYAGATDGRIYIWHLLPPSYGATEQPCLLRVFAIGRKSLVRTLTYLKDGIVAASADDKLFCFKAKCTNQVVDLLGPTEIHLEEDNGMIGHIDSVVFVDGHLALKRNDGSVIGFYEIFPLIRQGFPSGGSSSKLVKKFQFTASNKEELFMGGSGEDGTTIACGDEQGTLWFYNTQDSSGTAAKKLSWPEVNDPHAFSIGAYENCVNRVAFSPDTTFLVCVTANNLVCIWKRNSDAEMTEEI